MLPHDVTDFRELVGHNATQAQRPGTLSAWTTSPSKRVFDVGIVLVFSPILLLLLLLIGLVVLLSSGTPILFRQTRMGRDGSLFTIYKFRTMLPTRDGPIDAIAINSSDRITWIGRLLRSSKLDELPQIINVLIGDMSLVGPRPRVPEQQLFQLPCRPGISCPATLLFAREEVILAQISKDAVSTFYRMTILPAKHRLDFDYMESATLTSDLKILFHTVIGRWGPAAAPKAIPVKQIVYIPRLQDIEDIQSLD